MTVRPARRPPTGLGAFLGVSALTVVAHTLAATFTSLWVANAGEARFAVAVLAIRDATVAHVPLTPWDHLAAIQYAAVQLVLPAGDPVDAARWAGLTLGALATLLLWPVLRGLGGSVAAASIAVGALGIALPLLALRSAVTTAVVGVVWLSVAAALAVRDNIRAAGVAALLAVVTVPLAAAPLLAVAAAVSFDGTARLPGRLRKPVGVVAALAAAAVVLAVVLPGAPFAATTGPGIPAAIALAGVAVVVVVVVLASRADSLLRPVLVAAAPLVVVGLVPGPSGASNAAAAGLLVTPVVAVAIAIAADQVHARVQRKPLRVAIAVALAAVLAVPVSVAASWPTPSGGSLTGWVTTQTGPATVVVADPLDRAELRLAGFPAARLRTPTDPAVAGQLRLIAQRPGTDVVACPPGAVLASTPSGSGGAPAVVCGALTPATAVEAKVRARLGSALTTNTALKLDPGAAEPAARRQRRPAPDAHAGRADQRAPGGRRRVPGRAARRARRAAARGRALGVRRHGARVVGAAEDVAGGPAGAVRARQRHRGRTRSRPRLPGAVPDGPAAALTCADNDPVMAVTRVSIAPTAGQEGLT